MIIITGTRISKLLDDWQWTDIVKTARQKINSLKIKTTKKYQNVYF